MVDVSVDLAEKRIAVLSDNDGLAQAIELGLSRCLKSEIVKCVLEPLTRTGNQIEGDRFDLILVAVSLPTSEPVVMLNQASLAQQIGQVPLLIVSDRPFDPGENTRFFHLDFPVNANRLRDKVKEILQKKKGVQDECIFTVARLLKKLDVQVLQATSGSEALGLTLEHDFFLAIVDVQMPEMSGYELVELWRGNATTVDLPVVFISGIRTDEYRHRKAFDTGGAVDFLGKPFLPEILLAKAKVFLELYHQKLKARELADELDAKSRALAQVTRELEEIKSALLKKG